MCVYIYIPSCLASFSWAFYPRHSRWREPRPQLCIYKYIHTHRYIYIPTHLNVYPYTPFHLLLWLLFLGLAVFSTRAGRSLTHRTPVLCHTGRRSVARSLARRRCAHGCSGGGTCSGGGRGSQRSVAAGPRHLKREWRLAFTRYWQYQYESCVLNSKSGGSGGNHLLPNIDCNIQRGAMKEVSSAKQNIDLCTNPESTNKGLDSGLPN